MKRGEILGLRWLDVDMKSGRITVPHPKKPQRVVYLNNWAQQVLESVHRKESKPTDYVFTGDSVTPLNVSQAFLRACRSANVPDFCFRDLRHTMASWMMQQGADVQTLSTVLGYSDLRMSARYQYLSTASLSGAVKLLARGLSGKDHIFQQTPRTLSTALSNFVESISEKRRGTGDLRHSYAQRMVDKGASNEELAFALGHTDLDTPLVYFRSSQTQADRINQALGLSETYRNVIKIAHAKFISLDDLTVIKGDQQIAGMPHGVPISGIGGCESGQPTCPFNPVTSCYGCPRFMPLSSVSAHEAVLEGMREIVRLFYAPSHAERSSPAFQLESTISNIQKIISELKGPRHELGS